MNIQQPHMLHPDIEQQYHIDASSRESMKLIGLFRLSEGLLSLSCCTKFRNLVNDLDCEMMERKLERERYFTVFPNTRHQVLLGRSINEVYRIKTCCLCPCFSMPVIEIESRKTCPTCYPAICTSPLTNTWGGTERNSSQPYQNRQDKSSEH